MPTAPAAWAAGEFEAGSTIDTLRIETIGHLTAKRGVIRTRFPFHGIGLVLRGSGFHQVDQGPARKLRAPALFRIWPGPLFHYGPDAGATWEERYVCFSGPRVEDWSRWGWLPKLDRPAALLSSDMLAQLHRRLCGAFPPHHEIPIDEAKLELEQMIHAIHRQGVSASAKSDGLANLIRRWMKEPCVEEGALRAAARGLGMSYSGFRQHFARRTGLPPHQFLLRLRIDRASIRLIKTADPVKVVALECGFASPENFHRAFRQMKGVAPGEYRRRMALLTSPSR